MIKEKEDEDHFSGICPTCQQKCHCGSCNPIDLPKIINRYDVKSDDFLPVTQEWVTEVQNKITEMAIKLKKKDEQIQMLEALMKV